MAIVFYQVTKHIGGDFVLASAWNDDVSLNLGGLDEGIVHRFDGRQIAGDCALIGAVPLPYVPFDSSDQADIRFSITNILMSIMETNLGMAKIRMPSSMTTGFDSIGVVFFERACTPKS